MEGMSGALEACAAYFRARPVYRKLFAGFRRKYEGLGRFGGSVTLGGLSAEEKQALGGFLQRDLAGNKSVTVSAARMEKALAASRFAGLAWKDILEAYYGEALTVRKEEKRQQQEEREQYFREILADCPCALGREWLLGLLKDGGSGHGMLLQRRKEDPQGLKEGLAAVFRAVESLPAYSGKEKELLPVFAARITGDPHYFDEGKAGERLLTSFLRSCIAVEEAETLSRAEYKNRLFFEAGLLRDDLSNDVLAYGLRAWRQDGSLHPGIEGFYRAGEPVRLTLRTLGGLGRICAGESEGGRAGTAGQQNSRVFVVENPAVFSLLVEKHPDWTVLCGNGQLKLAVLVLMDRLAKESVFFYMGDFDPEGLLIAQRLKQRYAAGLELWNYRLSLYEAHCSDVNLSPARLAKLDRVCLPQLQQIAGAMRRSGRAAYQEAMAEEL